MIKILVLFCFLLSSCSLYNNSTEIDCPEKKSHELLYPSKSGIGVQMHWHQSSQFYIDLVRDLRPGVIRQDWFGIDSEAYHDLFVNLAKDIDARLIYTIKSGSFSPYQMRLEALRYKDSPVIWELENEPDRFMKAKDYRAWSSSVISMIRGEDPGACIVGPALTGIYDEKLSYLDDLIAAGWHKGIDAISIHLYYEYGENVQSEFDKFKDVICETGLPFMVSEGGSIDSIENPADQIAFVLRTKNIVLKNGGLFYVWYALEGGSNNALIENGSPTPLYWLLRDYISKL